MFFFCFCQLRNIVYKVRAFRHDMYSDTRLLNYVSKSRKIIIKCDPYEIFFLKTISFPRVSCGSFQLHLNRHGSATAETESSQKMFS